jgi:hypothetical protein
MTKNRLAESNRQIAEAAARIAFLEFKKAGGNFLTVEGRSAAAKVATLMGYTKETIPNDFGSWLVGPEAEQKFQI